MPAKRPAQVTHHAVATSRSQALCWGNFQHEQLPSPHVPGDPQAPRPTRLTRRAGQLLTQVFAKLDSFIRPDVTTMQINDRAEAFIVDTLKARPGTEDGFEVLTLREEEWRS